MQIDNRESRLAAKLLSVGQGPCQGADAAPTVDRQNEGIEDAAELRLILLDMGGLLPQSGGKQDWPSYRGKTFPLVYLSDPRIAQIPADLTPQDVHKLCLLSRNQIKPVSRILAISGILGHFQQKHLGR